MNARVPMWLVLPLVLAGACADPEDKGPPPRCGDGVLDPGEACDDGAANSDAVPGACRRDCSPARCGDGVVDDGEACDEGEYNDDLLPGACRTTCALPSCGDGAVDPGEECDDGPGRDPTLPDACRAGCVAPRCGDGIRDTGESCDEGEENSDELPDACRTTCVLAGCGDGVVDAGEECDHGEDNDDGAPGACRTTCRWARCGDGHVDPGETCDDGDGNSDTAPDACRTTCVLPTCGDGVVDAGEECDDGEGNDDEEPGACRTSCRAAHCGDGVVDPGEACDDGPANGEAIPDGCRPGCVPASCGDGVRDTGEGCDNGAANSDERGGACRTTCVVPRCGDGVIDPGEECDDGPGNGRPDGCRTTCVRPVCGDGIVDSGEVCDDGDDDQYDECGACVFVDPITPCSQGVVDLSGGVPWTGGPLEYEGTLAGARARNWATCAPENLPGVIHVVPVPRAGALVAEVIGLSPGFEPLVAIRDACSYPELGCGAVTPLGGPAVAVAEGVAPGNGFLWIDVQDLQKTGGSYRLRVTLTDPLAQGQTCHTNGVGGLCARPLACVDPDGDGTGLCGPLASLGEPCDPAGVADGCADGICTCPTPGCTTGVCTTSCGDGLVQPWEACDDGDPTGADNCTATCEVAGETCAQPYRIDLAPVDGGFEWSDSTYGATGNFVASCGVTGPSGDRVGAFTAPEAGDWAFQVTPVGSWDPVLALVTGSCDGAELACRAASDADPAPAVRVPLAAGETVWAVVDGHSTPYAQSGAFVLRVQRVTCGNGVVEPSEACDDGNTVDGDGCSSTCTRAGLDCRQPWPLVWDAAAGGAVWNAAIGDAVANNFGVSCGVGSAPGDLVARFVAPYTGTFSFEVLGEKHAPALSLRQGPCLTSTEVSCSRSSHIANTRHLTRPMAAGEEVWVVVEGRPPLNGPGLFSLRVRPVVCGDGIRAFAEECDDGNATAGDGCSPQCTLEAVEVEPNDNPLDATPVAVGTAVVAALSPAAETDWFTFPVTGGSTYALTVFSGEVGNCLEVDVTYEPRLYLELFSADLTRLLGSNDGDGAKGWTCPRLLWEATADGTALVRISHGPAYGRVVPRYFLEVTAVAP